MTREEVIAMARKAGLNDWMVFGRIEPEENILMRFATAVAQHERETCIQLLEQYEIPCGNSGAGELAAEWTYDALKTIRDEIRERGVKP
jgi:hypothetical protein